MTSLQQHLRLLSFMLRGDHEAAADHLHQPDLGNGFSQFVEHNRLQLLVYSLLAGSPARNRFPQAWLDQLKRFSLKQWPKQEILVRELLRISALLTGAGREFLVLKGPYLATRFFGGIDRREFCDLDILVRREDLASVALALRSFGYVRKSMILLHTGLTTRFTHAFDFVKPHAAVDLHWLLSANAAHDLDYEAIWRQRQMFVLRRHNFFVLSDEYEVVFNLISNFKDLERGAARLKSFVDLYFILGVVNRHLDWEAFWQRRRREKILRITANVLSFFFQLFECSDRFPEAAAALARERRHVKILPLGYGHQLLEGSPGALKNKAWAAGIYECSRLHVFLWWLVSLPFRLAVHDSGRYARFKAGVQQAKMRLSWARSAQDRRETGENP